MLMRVVKKFLAIRDKDLSPYERKKVRQLNIMSAYCIVFAFIFGVMNIFLQRYPQFIIDMGFVFIILLPTILIQKKKHYNIARNYFCFFILFLMVFTCIYNISRGEFLQTENAFLILAPIVVILYEKWSKAIIYLLIVVIFFAVHIYDYNAQGQAFNKDFIGDSMIYLVVFLAIFYFVNSYKQAFYNIYTIQTNLFAQLAQQKQELEKTNETKNKLFSIVAHDLKRPIHMLSGLLQMEGEIPKEELEKYRKQVKVQVRGINSLIENVLNWARSQLEGFSVNIKDIELKLLVNSEIEVFREQAGLKGIDLIESIPERLNVRSDPDHVSLVIRNIVNNCIKFTPPQGLITIKTLDTDKYVDLEIKDSGVGMDQTIIDNINEGNLISSKNGTHGETGSGLGLALCIEKLRKIGGSLLIESKLNQGSVFTIQLPKA